MRDDIGVALDKLQHEAVGDLAAVVELVHDVVVPEAGPALVHHLGLALRVEILPDLAHDAHDLALPGLQQRRIFFDEIENIFLRLLGKVRQRLLLDLGHLLRNGFPPQIVDLRLQVGLALFQALLLFAHRYRVRSLVSVDPVIL